MNSHHENKPSIWSPGWLDYISVFWKLQYCIACSKKPVLHSAFLETYFARFHKNFLVYVKRVDCLWTPGAETNVTLYCLRTILSHKKWLQRGWVQRSKLSQNFENGGWRDLRFMSSYNKWVHLPGFVDILRRKSLLCSSGSLSISAIVLLLREGSMRLEWVSVHLLLKFWQHEIVGPQTDSMALTL